MALAPRLVSLRDGNAMPQLGFGTWQIASADCPAIVGEALRRGYRAIDTAQGYGNEDGIGTALRDSGLDRAALFLTSKLDNANHPRDRVRQSLDESLYKLGTDYLDLFLIHWPVPQQNRFVEAWQVLIDLQKQGRLRSIGVSNFTRAQIELLIRETGVTPAVNQIELHPRFQQRDLRGYHHRRAIRIQSWSPLGPGTGSAAIWGKPPQPGLESLMSDPTLQAIAARHRKTVAQIIIRWHLDEGLMLAPKTTHPDRMTENIEVFDFALDAEERYRIEAMDTGLRLGPDPMLMNDL